MHLRRIIGIDPGSLRTGYGIVDVRGNVVSPVAWGVIRLDGEASFPDRLFRIHRELSDLILLHRPTEAAVEKVFLAKNPSSALKLGQARGAAIVTCGAPKEQVAGMVARLLGIRAPIPPDASDALATAFCRAVTRDL